MRAVRERAGGALTRAWHMGQASFSGIFSKKKGRVAPHANGLSVARGAAVFFLAQIPTAPRVRLRHAGAYWFIA